MIKINLIIIIIITTTITIIITIIITKVSIEADPVILPIEGAGPLTDSSSARAAIKRYEKIFGYMVIYMKTYDKI